MDPCVVDPMGPSSRLEGIQLSKTNFFKALGDKTFKRKLNCEKNILIQVELKIDPKCLSFLCERVLRLGMGEGQHDEKGLIKEKRPFYLDSEGDNMKK